MKKYEFKEGDGCHNMTPDQANEIKELEQTPYDTINVNGQDISAEYKGNGVYTINMHEQPEFIPFIAVKDNRILLKVDAQGIVSIDGQVVGYEPELVHCFPKPIRTTIEPYIPEQTRHQLSELKADEFNPDLPFEVSDDGINWQTAVAGNNIYRCHGKTCMGTYVVENIVGFVCVFNHIRNIKEPEFKQGDSVWGRVKNDVSDSKVWLYGTFEETKDGSLIINHQNQCPVEVIEIRPALINGEPQFPPFS